MDKIYLDPNVFVIHNFISIKEKDLLIEMDPETQDVIKARLSSLFDNTLDVVGSGVVRTKFQGDKELPHADQHSIECQCTSCINKKANNPTWEATAAIYLNKDYAGGTIHYTNQNISYDPEDLDLLVHPASEEYTHETFPIISGFKQIVLFFYKLKE
jgi:hypothetical protein